MTIWPYEYNHNLSRAMSFHLVPHLPAAINHVILYYHIIYHHNIISSYDIILLVRSVISLYDGVKTRVRLVSEEFEVKVGMHQGSVLSPFLFAVVVDVVTEFVREGTLGEFLYADDLILMSETIERFRNKFLKCKEAFESKGLKVNLGKTKVMVCGGITKDGISKSKVDPCSVCCLRVKANSVLFLVCGKLIHGSCEGVKMVTAKFSINFARRKCKANIGEAVEQEVKLCDEVEAVGEFTYLGDRVSAGLGCEVAVTTRTRCEWVKFWKHGDLLCCRRFPHKLKGSVYESYFKASYAVWK